MRQLPLLISSLLVFASAPLLAATPSMAELDVSVAPPASRSVADNPDSVSGSQIHFMYAVPQNEVDRSFDLSPALANTASSFNKWLATQTGGRKLKFDTFNKKLDVTFVRLPKTDAAYESFGVFKRDHIEADLKQMGMLQANKIYLVYYEGINPRSCGDAPYPPVLPGQVAVMYRRGLEGIPGVPPCASNPHAASPTAPPGYQEFAALHEIMHAMGIVSGNAPNHTRAGHVSDSQNDLMYAGDLPWFPSILDVNRNDYYNPGGLPAGLVNLANSKFLTKR